MNVCRAQREMEIFQFEDPSDSFREPVGKALSIQMDL